jgi:outer membrane biosynthesis protein TonB
MVQERRGLALALAIGLHLAIAAGLWWSAHWVRRPEPAMEVELWAGALEASPPSPAPEPSAIQPQPVPPPVRTPDIVEEKPAPKAKPVAPARTKPVTPPRPQPQPVKPAVEKPPRENPSVLAKPNAVAGRLKVPPLDTAAPRLDALAARAQAAEAAGRAREFDAYLAQVRNAVRRNMNYSEEEGPNLEVELEVRLLPDMTQQRHPGV